MPNFGDQKAVAMASLCGAFRGARDPGREALESEGLSRLAGCASGESRQKSGAGSQEGPPSPPVMGTGEEHARCMWDLHQKSRALRKAFTYLLHTWLPVLLPHLLELHLLMGQGLS